MLAPMLVANNEAPIIGQVSRARQEETRAALRSMSARGKVQTNENTPRQSA